MEWSNDDEAAWWDSARAGDGEALGRIFDLHHSRVYGLALRTLRDQHAAEDATAVAFLELWRRRGSVRVVDGSVLPWLLVTTANTSRNLARTARRHRALLAKLPRQEPAASADAEGATGLWNELDPRLTRALASLPRDTLGLVVLTAVEGYPIDDAARAVGMSSGAARQRLSRARSRLRDDLRDYRSAPAEEAHHD